MLAVYVDDSGTHSTSGLVLLAGLMGYPNQWDVFSELWKEKLNNPSPGKDALRRFHMVECQGARGEFSGWNRTATDFLVHELVQIFNKTMIRGHVCAIFKDDWDELVTGNMRRAWGDAEGFCLRVMYMRLTKAERHEYSSREIGFVFDNGPERALARIRMFLMCSRDLERDHLFIHFPLFFPLLRRTAFYRCRLPIWSHGNYINIQRAYINLGIKT
jgi:hypothetical protein